MIQIAERTENPTSLPWYNFASTRPVLDAIWQETISRLAAKGYSNIPATLDHQMSFRDLANFPKLTLGQCCGLDLFQQHACNVVPIAAPVISVLDTPPGTYFSYIVARQSTDLNSPLTVAVNNDYSHSGDTAIRAWLRANKRHNFSVFMSGSHSQSVKALRSGHADVAAIDALSWQFIDTQGLSILGASDPAPAPPFIAGVDSEIPAAVLVAALNEAFVRHGHPLGITGVVPVSKHQYLPLAAMSAGLKRT